MSTVLNYLKIAALGTLDGLVMRDTWTEIWIGLLSCIVMAIRVLILVTFPISTPLIAWLIWLDDRKHERDAAAATVRLLRDIHRNGRSR